MGAQRNGYSAKFTPSVRPLRLVRQRRRGVGGVTPSVPAPVKHRGPPGNLEPVRSPVGLANISFPPKFKTRTMRACHTTLTTTRKRASSFRDRGVTRTLGRWGGRSCDWRRCTGLGWSLRTGRSTCTAGRRGVFDDQACIDAIEIVRERAARSEAESARRGYRFRAHLAVWEMVAAVQRRLEAQDEVVWRATETETETETAARERRAVAAKRRELVALERAARG